MTTQTKSVIEKAMAQARREALEEACQAVERERDECSDAGFMGLEVEALNAAIHAIRRLLEPTHPEKRTLQPCGHCGSTTEECLDETSDGECPHG